MLVPTASTYQKADTLKQFPSKDTVYGIEHEALIPVRHTTMLPQKKMATDHLLTPSPLKIYVENWQIITLLFAVLLLGIMKAFNNNRYQLYLKALFNDSIAQEITREEQFLFHRSSLFLALTQLFTFSLLAYQLEKELRIKIGVPLNFYGFLMIMGGVLLIYVIKFGAAKLLSFVFNETTAASIYIFNVALYNYFLGILFIPMLCVSYFTTLPFSLLLSDVVFPVISLVFLMRLMRLFAVGKSLGTLYVYIFLYICSLEILPLVVLYQFLTR